MKWHVSEVDDSNISDQERKCPAVRQYWTCSTDDERFDVARRYYSDCVKCSRRGFCYTETLMDMCPKGGE